MINNFEWIWCETCDCAAIECPDCKNTTCTGGTGEIDGKKCETCDVACRIADEAHKNGTAPTQKDGLRIKENALDKLLGELE